MSFYTLATVEIQNRLRITASEVNQVWLANDATGPGSLKSLKKWQINIIEESGRYGYYVNESKPWVILKNQTLLKKQKVCSVARKYMLQQKERGTYVQLQVVMIFEQNM